MQNSLQKMISKFTRNALLLIFAIVTLSSGVRIKPITVSVENKIGSSKFAGEVVITGYSGKGQIYFKSTAFTDTLSVAHCEDTLKNGYVRPWNLANNTWTENWPYIGDTVFVVVGPGNWISIFGKRVGNDYRLWSTWSTGSTPIFEFRAPLRSINSSHCIDNSPIRNVDPSGYFAKFGNLESCMDGCLMPIDLAQSLILKYRQEFNNKLASIQISNFVGQTTHAILHNDTLGFHGPLVWNFGPHKKIISFTLPFVTGKSVEVHPVNDRNNPIRFDPDNPFDWNKFWGLKIKQIRWKD
jgi:hypothetical protein